MHFLLMLRKKRTYSSSKCSCVLFTIIPTIASFLLHIVVSDDQNKPCTDLKCDTYNRATVTLSLRFKLVLCFLHYSMFDITRSFVDFEITNCFHRQIIAAVSMFVGRELRWGYIDTNTVSLHTMCLWVSIVLYPNHFTELFLFLKALTRPTDECARRIHKAYFLARDASLDRLHTYLPCRLLVASEENQNDIEATSGSLMHRFLPHQYRNFKLTPPASFHILPSSHLDILFTQIFVVITTS
jgi:hypothetical protein